MRIEEVTAEALRKVPDSELYVMRLRFIQLDDMLSRYRLLIEEMKNRGLRYSPGHDIDRAVFHKSMLGIDAGGLGDVVVVPDYVSIAGSFVKSDKDPHFVYAPRGPHSSYIPLYDLVLRPKEKLARVRVDESDVKKADRLRLKFLGTGAMDSKRKGEALLVQYKDMNVLIDANEDLKSSLVPRLDAVLVCDEKEKYMKDARRLAKIHGLPEPEARAFAQNGLEIKPFAVKHTRHRTYGYEIKANGVRVVYAPEFLEPPIEKIKGADLAILEGSAWSRPIMFAGEAGGHAAILETWEAAREAGAKRIVFTHIGKPVEAQLEDAKELGIEIARDGQTLQPIAKAQTLRLSPGRPFTPLKSRGGYGKYEFGDIEALWTIWAQGYIPDPGIAVETKFDGFRVQIHKRGSEVKVYSEDAKRDISDRIPDATEEIAAMDGTFILDGELTVWVKGKKIERKDMPSYIMAKKPPEFTPKIAVFDCLWYDDRDLHNRPWTERQKFLDQVFAGLDEKLLERVKPDVTRTEREFKAAVRKHSAKPYSEGAMCKVVNSTYPLDGETAEWAKFKNLKELRVVVLRVNEVK